MDITVLNCNMNNLQKIFVMVGFGSLVLIVVSIYGLGFEPNSNFFFEEVWEKNKWSGLTIEHQKKVRELEGNPNWEPSFLYTRTNWLGIIAVFNIVVSSVGFFLFKDK